MTNELTTVTYDGLLALQVAIANELVTFEVPVNHYFVEGADDGTTSGVYAREAVMPKGMVGVGKIHKYPHLSIMTKGDLSIASPQGVVRVTAPYIAISAPGAQRAFYAHEDSIWMTVHGTAQQDVEVIEKTLVVDSYTKFLEYVEEQKLLEDK